MQGDIKKKQTLKPDKKKGGGSKLATMPQTEIHEGAEEPIQCHDQMTRDECSEAFSIFVLQVSYVL